MLERLFQRQLEAFSARHAVLLDQQQRAWRRMLRIPHVAAAALSTPAGVTAHDVVLELGCLRLLRYRRMSPAAHAHPVLLCYALVNRPYILDLQAGKSVIRRYLEQGFEVYMIDWGVPGYADRHLSIEDYVCRFLGRVVDFVLKQHGSEGLHLVGYCMGGTFSTLFTALYPERIKTLTLLAAPIDFTGGGSILELWTQPKNFDVDRFIDAHGNCPAWFLQFCFLYTKPVQNLLEKGITFYEQMDDPRFLSNYLAMERWVNDNVPVAGETFREFVKKLYQQNQLVSGQLHLESRRVDLSRITCPLLLLTAKNDHLVAPASTRGLRAHVSSRQVREMTIDAGHVGLVVSSKAHKTLWPEATSWLTS